MTVEDYRDILWRMRGFGRLSSQIGVFFLSQSVHVDVHELVPCVLSKHRTVEQFTSLRRFVVFFLSLLHHFLFLNLRLEELKAH